MTSPTIALSDDPSSAVEHIAAALLAGEVVLLPTDTVYGLVALPGIASATARLFELKGRATATPIAVLCADVDQAVALAGPEAGPALAAVGARWWPGPLTIVTPRRPGVELYLGEPATTIGLRVPDHEVVRAVAAVVGPVAATSANRHGEPTPTTAPEAAASLGSDIALIVDGGPLRGVASTVINATTRPWTVLREGSIDGSAVIEAAAASSSDDR
ncbi:MAG: L-threonylcarbamoyladenylate synthase [Microthrixaceae bacterium]